MPSIVVPLTSPTRRTPHMAPTRHTRRRMAVLTAAATAVLATGLASALPAGAATTAPEGVIQYEDAANAVSGSYIVTLKSTRAASDAGRAVAARYGASIQRTYTKALNGYAITASETEAKRLA